MFLCVWGICVTLLVLSVVLGDLLIVLVYVCFVIYGTVVNYGWMFMVIVLFYFYVFRLLFAWNLGLA